MSDPPVPLFARDLDDPEIRRRLVVTATAAVQVDALPWPDLPEELTEGQTVPLGGESVEVLDLATRVRWRIRRAQCGLGPCCCDLQAWPADRTAEIPPPELFDAWAFHADEIPPDAPPAA